MFPWGIDAGGYHTWAVAQLGASVPLPSQNPRLVAIVLGVSMPVAIVLGRSLGLAQVFPSLPKTQRLVAIVLGVSRPVANAHGVSMPVAIVVARLDAGDPLPSHGVLMPVAIVLGRSLSLAQVFPSLLGGW